MASRRNIRTLAMQVLYQIDVRGLDDLDAIRESLTDWREEPAEEEAAPPSPQEFLSGEVEPHAPAKLSPEMEAYELAQAAWKSHPQADEMLAELAPNWPTYRQPPVDRAILRLAYHEIATNRAPDRVVLNEAVELAKLFCGEQSPAFINGVLDKIARRLRQAQQQQQ
ncbi:MAG: transcription antitermination factor NusB [Phycisphaeraceae bacterium]|nr:transcription antitermination factor NusB [Phycisphaeraceae bacterium]